MFLYRGQNAMEMFYTGRYPIRKLEGCVKIHKILMNVYKNGGEICEKCEKNE